MKRSKVKVVVIDFYENVASSGYRKFVFHDVCRSNAADFNIDIDKRQLGTEYGLY